MTLVDRALRQLFRQERLPAPLLWWLAGDAMSTWYRMLRRGLAPTLGGKREAERVLARLAAPVYRRHYAQLAQRYPRLPSPEREPRAVGLLMGGLTEPGLRPRAAWMFTDVGGAPASLRDRLRAARLVGMLPFQHRWHEVTTHLGEVLIALTHGLPEAGLLQANAVLGRLCFDGGVRYAERMKRAFALPATPAAAIEVLRVSEYIFRVNPEHWSDADEASHTGFIEGTACPWYGADGWDRMHCGIFGQFQAGIGSVFGLKYQLTRTIPKHGGHTCRIDLVPLGRRS